MVRTLRPRKSAAGSYAQLAGAGSDDETFLKAVADNESSGSEFSPPPEETKTKDGGDDPDDDDEDEDDEEDGGGSDNILIDEEDDDLVVGSSKVKVVPLKRQRSKAQQKPTATRTSGAAKSTMVTRIPGLSGIAGRQKYALPVPNSAHRHRAPPLFTRLGQTERLTSPPTLFKSPEITPTRNFTHEKRVSDRVTRSWGMCNGYGPIWELVEDRSSFKEAHGDFETEAKRRPLVYENVKVMDGWEILDAQSGATYLPTADVTAEDGSFIRPPPIVCSFGPFGSQKRVEMEMFEVQKLSEFFPSSTSHVFNAGAPVWGLDWCPIFVEHREARSHKQYLAVATFPSSGHTRNIGVRLPRPVSGCIQIWSLSSSGDSSSARKRKNPTSDSGRLRCEMVICHDSGPAHEIKWCPLPSDDKFDPGTNPNKPRKLGLLSGTFEDGSFSIYAIPEPVDVTPADHDETTPILVKLPQPILRLELEDTACWSFDWANSEILAIGTANGVIAVYNAGKVLRGINEDAVVAPITNLIPTHYITVHQSAVRALCWVRVPPSDAGGESLVDEDPTVIASGGYDGVECMTDIREGRGSMMNRTRDVITVMSYTPYVSGPVTIDHENIVKIFSASPSMLGRGHTLLEPLGPVWDLGTSDYHPILSVAGADGICCTTNMMRSARRSGAVPFFVHKIFQMDYNRIKKEYRMLEHFLPVEARDRAVHSRVPKKSSAPVDPVMSALTNASSISTGAWPTEVALHRTTWNAGNGMANAGLLASGTASGLVRIDNLWGRFMKNKVPYTGVAAMRLEEGQDGMEVDSDESGGSE